jgi:hypothetical protein
MCAMRVAEFPNGWWWLIDLAGLGWSNFTNSETDETVKG